MEKKYILSCSSIADLTAEQYKSRDIKHIDIAGNVNAKDIADYFVPFLEEGYDILHVAASSGLAGFCNAAAAAKEELKNRYPERKICVIDSLGASAGYGLMMETLADKRDEGADIEELAAWVKTNKLKIQQWGFFTDVKSFVKKGRISKAAALKAKLLKACPLANVNYAGQIIPRARVKGKNNVIKEIVNKMELLADNGLDYSGKCYISYSSCYKVARAVADLVEKKFPKLNGRVVINSMETATAGYAGTGAVTLSFWGNERKD